MKSEEMDKNLTKLMKIGQNCPAITQINSNKTNKINIK